MVRDDGLAWDSSWSLIAESSFFVTRSAQDVEVKDISLTGEYPEERPVPRHLGTRWRYGLFLLTTVHRSSAVWMDAFVCLNRLHLAPQRGLHASHCRSLREQAVQEGTDAHC